LLQQLLLLLVVVVVVMLMIMMMMLMMALRCDCAAGVSYQCDKVDLKVDEGAARCARCTQRVYFNEEKKAIGRSWHARCFSCCQFSTSY